MLLEGNYSNDDKASCIWPWALKVVVHGPERPVFVIFLCFVQHCDHIDVNVCWTAIQGKQAVLRDALSLVPDSAGSIKVMLFFVCDYLQVNSRHNAINYD